MSGPFSSLLQRLRIKPNPASVDSDTDLLDRYAREHDEDAFAVLVARHGPLVLGVCRRVLSDAHAAEDAFQATFLVLARRAGTLHRPEKLVGWLYGVAARIAREARRSLPRQHRTGGDEIATRADSSSVDPLADLTARELLVVLEEEVQRLPLTYRLPVVMCCLKCLSQEEAAARLGCSPGQLKGRLERGRKQLHDRLARRGLAPAAVLGAASAMTAPGPLSASLASSTVRTASAFATGQTSAEFTSTALAEEALRAMRSAKFRTIAAVAFLSAVVAGAALAVASSRGPEPHGSQEEKRAEPGAKPELKGVPEKNAIPAELAEFQGLWQDHLGGAEHQNGEELVRQPVLGGKCFFVRGDRLIWLTDDGRPTGREEQIALDTKADPKRITLTPVLIDGKVAVARSTVGIFEFTKTGPRVHFGLGDSPPKQFLEFGKPIRGVDGKEWLISRKKLGDQ